MIIKDGSLGVVYPESIVRGTSPSNALNNFIANGRGAYVSDDYNAVNTGWVDSRKPVPYPGDGMHWEWDVDAQAPVAVANPPESYVSDPSEGVIVARYNNLDVTTNSIIEVSADGAATAVIELQKRDLRDNTNKNADDPAEELLVYPNQLVTLSDTSIVLLSDGSGSFTLGPETRRGLVSIDITGNGNRLNGTSIKVRFV